MRKLYTNFLWGFTGEEQTMLVEDGKVAWREPGRHLGSDAEVVDLGGKYLLPGFIDAHCHILPTGLDLKKLHLGKASTPDEVLDLLSQRHIDLPECEWLEAVHYDQTKFPTGEHLTKTELDKISSTRPILLRHSNGHASIGNSAALAAAKVNDDTPDPRGGSFGRDSSGRVNGVLLEKAHEQVSAAAPEPTIEQMTEAILAAGEKMADLGITCASDMMTGRWDVLHEIEAYRLAAERGCRIRTRLYVLWAEVLHARGIGAERLKELDGQLDHDRCRVAGIKIFADGAIGSATAGIYGHFTGTEDRSKDTDGQLMYSPERLNEMVKTADAAGYSIAIHSIGDYSTDLVMNAYDQVDDAKRHRIEHVMLLSDAQIERLHKLGVHCTMQPEFLMRFGHAYKRQLGPERASRLKRARSVIDAGIPLSFNSDRPIVPGDPWDGIEAASNRPEGFVKGEEVSRHEAIEAYTRMGAVANSDDNMGLLTAGQLADLQILAHNPIQTGPSH